MRTSIVVTIAAVSILGITPDATAADNPSVYAVGVAKIDITPTYPVRLSGFGFRREESEGVTQRIWAKALAIDDGEPAVLLTIDTCGISAEHLRDLAERLAKKVKLKPERLAVTVTHTHTAPMLKGVLATLFGVPIPKEHQERIDRYTTELLDNLEKVSLAALADRKPARLSWGIGRVGFAANRRTNGGPVDHDLPVLAVHDLDGKVRAVYASYACHCVTLSHNKIGGDWAGFAQERIEDDYPGAIALVSIGCGADSNPHPRGNGDDVGLAGNQGKEIAAEVKRVLDTPLNAVKGKVSAAVKRFDLPLAKLPTRDEWERRATKTDAIGYHARVQLERLNRGASLRERVNYSVQSWAFGDSLAMMFLPGEVVVDYSLRMKKELDGLRLWVNAYSNDVPCYIPSERILKEGGYEGGGAMTYYDLPAPLAPGLEQKIVTAVIEQIGKTFASPFDSKRTGGSMPMSPQQSLAVIRIKPDLAVELVASEPMVIDPVAIDWGPDGRLWVAEMHDYPAGADGQLQPGGRVRVLKDTNGDGRYDESTVFLDKIPFPTGVTSWRDGVLVCAAPDILYAEDGDGDGRADIVRRLFSGFGTENYQARVNSLEYGLDGWVYGSCGLFGGTIKSFAGGEPVKLGNRDFRIKPDTGELEPATGRTQQGRVRDDAGNWFGCDNSNLCWHYPLDDHYLRRNPHVAPPNTVVSVPAGPNPNRLFPARSELQLFKLTGPHGQATAACGLGIYRDDWLGPNYTGNVFVCESVNLVVHRRILEPSGSTFIGRRASDEQESEFLTSTDNWFRPVQVRTGPDGCLWIVDMYRFVIEHPQWIPPNERSKLDFRAGSTMGRIYRIRPKDRAARPMPRLDQLDTKGLVAALDSPNGWQRDMAGQMLVWKKDTAAATALGKLVREADRSEARLHALCVLEGLGALDSTILEQALGDRHPSVRRQVLRLAEGRVNQSSVIGPRLMGMVDDSDPHVRLQLANSLGAWRHPQSGAALVKLAQKHKPDVFLMAAVLSSLNPENLAEFAIGALAHDDVATVVAAPVVSSAFGFGSADTQRRIVEEVTKARRGRFTPWQFAAVARVFDTWKHPEAASVSREDAMSVFLRPVTAAARSLAMKDDVPDSERIPAISVLGREQDKRPADLELLRKLISPRNPLTIQAAAVAALGRIPDDEVAAVLTSGWSTYSPSIKAQVLDLCCSRDPWQRHLLTCIESKQIPPAQIDTARRGHFLAHQDRQVRSLAEKLFGAATSADRKKTLEDYHSTLTLQGDSGRGNAVFERSCAKCHRFENAGHTVGPDLATLTNKSPEYLLSEILDPSKNLDSRYVEYFAMTKNGQTLTGILAAETSTSITLRAAEGKDQVLLRTEIDELQSHGKSLMPDGLEKELSRQDLADVIAFATAGQQKEDAPTLARKILDDSQPADARQAIIDKQHDLAPALIAAMVADMKPGTPEEYRRIPWIWRVSVAAGKRNQTEQVRRILEISMPKAGEPLRDWQAVVIGGGIINGISLQNVWPGQRLAKLLEGQKEFSERWHKTLALAGEMADNEKVPVPTRYDALRIIALDSWERRGKQLAKYLEKGMNDELQMGAISGLSDMEAPQVAGVLLSGIGHYSDGNRKLALEALLRTDERTSALLDAIENRAVMTAWLAEGHKKALREHANEKLRSRAHKLLGS